MSSKSEASVSPASEPSKSVQAAKAAAEALRQRRAQIAAYI